MIRRNTLVVFFALLATGALAVQAGAVPAVTAQEETPQTNETQTESEMANETQMDNATQVDGPASITFDDQETNGTTVTVSNVTLTEPGYVVIHNASILDRGNALDGVIGVSEYLPAGEYDNVTITLFDVPGEEFGETDNETEMPTNESEEPATETATPAPNETVEETVTETETPEEAETPNETGPSDNETDTNETETPEEPVANDTEEPAANDTDNETASDVQLTGNQTLTAMIHVEDSGNETFDFVQVFGLEDPAVEVDGEPVTDTAKVIVVNETAANDTAADTEDSETTATETVTEDSESTENETGATESETGITTEADQTETETAG